MKILFFIILYLISGKVGCVDVIGYSGGSLMIYCKNEHSVHGTYFCEHKQNQCINMTQTQNSWSRKARFSGFSYNKDPVVLFRQLEVQDAGLYQCGEPGIWYHLLNITVNRDACCVRSKNITGYLGETMDFSCNYPNMFKENSKYFYKLDGHNITYKIHIYINMSHKGRFFMTDDRQAKVLYLNINDVRESDRGVYYCGAWNGGQSVSYYSFFTEIQLRVTERRTITSKNHPSLDTSQSGSSIIISVCVCVALLLFGGSALMMYKLRFNRTQVSESNTAFNWDLSSIKLVLLHSNSDTAGYVRPSPPTDSLDEDLKSTVYPTEDEELSYTTFRFQKNPDFASTKMTWKEDSRSEYMVIKQHTSME